MNAQADPCFMHCRTSNMTLVGQHRRRNEVAAALSAVTFCSWHPVAAMVGVDRFVARAIGANSAIGAIGGTTPWYPCS